MDKQTRTHGGIAAGRQGGRVQRVAVVGNSGSGKTTAARRLAAVRGLPHVELDGIHHQANWTPLPTAEFRARVAAALPADGAWIVDGNYSEVRDIVWGRADTLVWLDLPRHVVVPRIVWRSLRRAALREELWNGNRERFGNLVKLDREENIILWSLTQHGTYRERYARVPADPTWGHLRFVRLRSRAAVEAWLRTGCA